VDCCSSRLHSSGVFCPAHRFGVEARWVICQIVLDSIGCDGTACGQIPSGFLRQKYFGVTAIHEEGTPSVHRGWRSPPPGGHPIPLRERDYPTAWGLQRIPNTFPLSDRVLKTSHRIARALLTHVQKAPGPSGTKASPTPTRSTKFIGTSWRGGFPEWNHKTIAAGAAPGAATAPPLQTFRF
jgi:hypothetical protein